MILLPEHWFGYLIAFGCIIGGVWHFLVHWERLQVVFLGTVTHFQQYRVSLSIISLYLQTTVDVARSLVEQWSVAACYECIKLF